MVRLCDDLRQEFDWILIDSPAGSSVVFRNVLAPADMVIVVTNPEVTQQFAMLTGSLGWSKPRRKACPLIINRLNPALVKRGDMLTADDVLELLAVELDWHHS
jgi:septum site-determining protein MinD